MSVIGVSAYLASPRVLVETSGGRSYSLFMSILRTLFAVSSSPERPSESIFGIVSGSWNSGYGSHESALLLLFLRVVNYDETRWCVPLVFPPSLC